MATALLRSVILPCSSSSDSSAALLPGVVLSPTVVSVGRSSFSLSEFSGLKIHANSSPALASLNSRTSRVFCRGGRILCEAQETALGGSNSNVLPLESRLKGSKINEATGPVLVEFWAPWCGPCRMIHPVIAELSEEYAGKLKCFKLNTDDNPSIATQYGIRSIPTIMIFINGEKKDAVIGAVPKTTLIASIEKFL